ncbi:MAG TPA: GNAT family N-acetyltransferase [Dehalococcoidia bacterium]|nr:GNAT family N-acetyltransferase [Dehalococcoidia bacterium]
MLEIRPARLEEMGEFVRTVSTALALDPSRPIEGLLPEWTLCAFEDGRLATTYGAWPLTMRFNGNAVPVAGVTCVSTNPIYRRRGYLRRIMETDFVRLKEAKQQPWALLYASQAAIYQRFGYGIVSTHYSYRVEPRYLQFATGFETRGSFREVSKDEEFGLLVDLYRRFREERTGYVHRGRAMWEANVLAPPPPGHTRTIVVYEEGGEARGYLVYSSGEGRYEGPGPGQEVRIADLVWLDIGCYRAIWQYLSRMELAREVIWPAVPADDPLPHLLLEPRMLRASWRDGLLARVIDVPAALMSRPYPEKAVLRFEVADAMAPWNEGVWEMVTGPEAEVRPLTASASHPGAPTLTRAPDVTMDVNTLAMLAFNQITATEAARMGRLEVHDAAALPRWDAALRTKYRPFCADNF